MDRFHQHPPVSQHHTTIAYLFDIFIPTSLSYVACFILSLPISIMAYCTVMVPSVPARL